MEISDNHLSKSKWTWADQLSSTKFWGVFFFFALITIPNVILTFGFHIFGSDYDIDMHSQTLIMSIRTFSSLGGLWLAWLMIKAKNNTFLYVLSGLLIVGLVYMLVSPTVISISIAFFFLGLIFGVISLWVPSVIAGGRGGSEMFVVSFGIITFFQSLLWSSTTAIVGYLMKDFGTEFLIIVCIGFVAIGLLILVILGVNQFENTAPQARKSIYEPIYRDPATVVLLCLIPFYNVYYILNLSYRLHNEVYSLRPTNGILTPKAAVLIGLFVGALSPMVVASLNTNVIKKMKEEGNSRFYKNWIVILFAFLFVPISFALIQANINKCIDRKQSKVNFG